MKKIYSLILIFFALTSVAQDYDTLMKTIMANNLDIAAMEASIESEVLSIKSENNLPETDIDFEHQFVRTQENRYIPQDYYGKAIVKFDNSEKETMEMPFMEVPVNTLPNVTMIMFKYKNCFYN